jgi:lipid A 3-O-deacylase
LRQYALFMAIRSIYKKHSLILIILLCHHFCFGQAQPPSPTSAIDLTQEVSLKVDNDIFFLIDWYYTAGHTLSYRRLVQKNSRLFRAHNRNRATPATVLITYELGNKIFSPKRINTEDIRKMDRPYAGWSYGAFSITGIAKPSCAIQYGAELGVVGKISGMGQLQEWVHRQTGYYRPRGWNSQIRDELVFNLETKWWKSIKLLPHFDLVSLSNIKAGTGENKLSQEFTLRMIDFNPVGHSVFANNRLAGPNVPDVKEVFIFISFGVDYNVTNIFLEGSLFESHQSPFTVQPLRWVMKRRLGIMYSDNRNSLVFDIHHIGPEVFDTDAHNFVRLLYGFRF